jgi:hypothetical protein
MVKTKDVPLRETTSEKSLIVLSYAGFESSLISFPIVPSIGKTLRL